MTANWHWAEWHTDPAMPRNPWRTLEVVPPDKRESTAELIVRLNAHMAEQDRAIREAGYDRAFPNRVAARHMRERRGAA